VRQEGGRDEETAVTLWFCQILGGGSCRHRDSDWSGDWSHSPSGLAAGQSVSRKAGWGDPLLAGRYHYDFGNGFGLTAYGDFGRFGLGAHTEWQVMGTVDYALNSWINLRLGYRTLNFNYTASGGDLGFSVHVRGPVFAATFPC
jgi:hypothetical protein